MENCNVSDCQRFSNLLRYQIGSPQIGTFLNRFVSILLQFTVVQNSVENYLRYFNLCCIYDFCVIYRCFKCVIYVPSNDSIIFESWDVRDAKETVVASFKLLSCLNHRFMCY
jgi:hypothetical protein